MVARPRANPIPGTGNRNGACLESCVVGCRESPIGRQATDRSICEIASDQSAKIIHFLFAGLMFFHIAFSQPLLPTRHHFLSQTLSHLVARWLGNDRGSLSSL